MTSSELRFKGSPASISNWKFLWAHAVSGMHFLNADGVLGLGIEFNGNAQTLSHYNPKQKNHTSASTEPQPETRPDDNNDDNDSFEFSNDDDIDEEGKGEVQSPTDGGSPPRSPKYDYFEAEMGVTKRVIDTFKSLNFKQFSLYLADDDSLKPQIIFGEPNSKLIYKPGENKILWIQSMLSD